MTDETPTPAVPRAIVCPVEDCASLIPDTVEDQRRHRRGHEHDEKVVEGIRRALRTLSSRMDNLEGATKDDVRKMQGLVESAQRSVSQIEVPKQLPQMEITRPTGWDDEDDDPDVDAATIEDDWAALTEPATPADEPAETTAKPDDADDEALVTSSAAAFPQHLGLDDATIGLGTRQPWAGR